MIGRETEPTGIGYELFKNYFIALQRFKPDYFLYENVSSMSDEIRSEITKTFGCEPMRINGALTSAAERDRLFWTNIPVCELPKDKNIKLRDILESEVDEKYFYDYPIINIDMSKQVCGTMQFNNNEMHKRIFNPDFKVHTLTTCGGGHHQKKVMIDGKARRLTPVEYERCMNLPDGYTKSVAETHRYNGLGNGWDALTVEHILSHIEAEIDDKLIVCSMYDGIGTGRYVIDKLGYTNIEYYAYEIDVNAIHVAKSNYPDIVELGDAFQVRDKQWSLAYIG
jgi:DNA (cytosine-5)-methyltransferase 3A